MAYLYGRNYTREELLSKIGDILQIGGARLYELADGRERGVQAVDFRTGTGFNFTVLAGRAMDISYAEYCGRPLCWRSPAGDVAASYYEPEGIGWLRGFYGGLLTTCGLTYLGAPCVDEGVSLGLHGRISYTPAKNLHVDGGWEGDDYIMWAQGRMREAVLFGDNLELRRRVWTRLGEKRLFINDEIENIGHRESPLMILYHINGGFPVVDEGGELISPTVNLQPRDDDARVGMEEYNRFQAPAPGFKERVYYHDMKPDKDGYVYVALVNRSFCDGEGFGFYVKYRKDQLDQFTEWKMNGTGEYVVGIEPANCRVEGRAKARERGELKTIKPGEKFNCDLEIGVLSSKDEIAEFEEKVKGALSS